MYYEKNLISFSALQVVDDKAVCGDTILALLPDTWGRQKGGRRSKGNTLNIRKPEFSEEFAEFIGVLLGDGNVFRLKKKNTGVYSVRIAGDSRHDREYLSSHVAPLGKRLFGLTPNILFHKTANEMFVIFYGKLLVEFFTSIGIPDGNKMHSQVTIPKWIMKNNVFLQACIRGLIDTDGSIHRMSKRDSHLLRISFTAHNKKLMSDVRIALQTLGYFPSKVICGTKLYISRQSDIQKYIREIGFSNNKH